MGSIRSSNIFFFFSSRRRHTRHWRDWSSDVCSSDLRDTLAPFQTDTLAAYALLDGPRFLVEILNAGHFAFSDICAGAIFGTADCAPGTISQDDRSEEHTSELQSRQYLVCRLLLEKKK